MHAGFRYILDMKTLLMEFKENRPTLLIWELPKSYNKFQCMRRDQKNNDSIKNYCDAVALTDNFVGVVSRHEKISENIDFDN